MKELVFFISIFSISVGISGIILALLIYIRERNNTFLLYIFTILMWTTIQLYRILDFYFYYLIKYNSILINIILRSTERISSGIFVILYTILIYKLFKEKISKIKLTIFISISIIAGVPIGSLSYKFPYFCKEIVIFVFFQVMLQLIFLSYLAFYILKKSKKIDDLTIKKVIKLFFVITMIFHSLIIDA